MQRAHLGRPSLALALALSLPACGGGEEPPDPGGSAGPTSGGPPAVAPGASARAVERLAELAAEAERHNPFIGSGPLEEVRGQVEALTEGTPPLERAATLHRAGVMSLDRGLYEDALDYLGRSREVARSHPDEVSEDARTQIAFTNALAWMRLGETRNCVALHTSQSCILPIGPRGVHTDPDGSRNALAILEEILAEHPTHVPSRWITNIAAMTLGEYPEGVDPRWRVPPAAWESEGELRHFVDVGPENGLSRTSLTGAVLVEDLTGDGRLDVMASSWDLGADLALFPNPGGGRFRDEAGARGLAGITGGVNLRQADADGDGDVDVFVVRGAWWGDRGRHPSSLLLNDGAGAFVDGAYDAGLAGDGLDYPSHSAAWADVDRDGDVDLFSANESGKGFEGRSQLFLNDGAGSFVDVAEERGVVNGRLAKGCAFGDVDADGDPDLYVANFLERNRLYVQGEDGTFADVAEERLVADPIAAATCWFFDADEDGALDLFVGTQRTFLENVACEYLGCETEGIVEPSQLFLGDGAGGFAPADDAVGLARVDVVQGGAHGDLDDDGRLDVYLATGFATYEALLPNRMLRNTPEGFLDVTTVGGFGHLQKGNSVAFADLDDDGDQDVLVQVGGQYTVDAFGDVLFENPGGANAWVHLVLRGAGANTSALGAEVRLFVGDRVLLRTVGGAGSHAGSPLRLEVGLGEAERVDRVEVRWPGGATQVFEDLAARRRWRLVEGESAAQELERSTFELLP